MINDITPKETLDSISVCLVEADQIEAVQQALANAAGIAVEMMQRVSDALSTLRSEFLAVWDPVIKNVVDRLETEWERIKRAAVPPKWWRLYKRSKKARVRKKYQKKITHAALLAFNS